MSELVLLGDLAPVGMQTCRLDQAADASALVLANLETPLAAPEAAASPKAGPHLRGEAAVLGAWRAAWPNLVLSLANNHLPDYGAAGIAQTLAALDGANIRGVGAGMTLAAAARPLQVTAGPLRVGIIAVSDRWFGVAHADRAGVHGLTSGVLQRIEELRREVDRVIVTVHGGNEMSPWPSSSWQNLLRTFVAAGADVVHAHHPHVPQGWERHHRGWIFFGLGNTLINPAAWPHPLTRRSWRVRLDLADLARPPQVSAWTCDSCGGGMIHLRPDSMLPPDAPDARFRNDALADPVLLEGLHQEYALRVWNEFYADRAGLGDSPGRRLRLMARTLRDFALGAVSPSRWRHMLRQRQLYHYHLFASATHACEIATALGVLSGELPDRRSAVTRAMAAEGLPAELFRS